jgi:hypothetical protein
VVAPGFLQNPEVRRWLNGIEPAWTMLEFNSLNALRHEPSWGGNHAIRLDPKLTNTEISGSAVTANTLLLLRRAAETGGLKLTATGNLSQRAALSGRDGAQPSRSATFLRSAIPTAQTLFRTCPAPPDSNLVGGQVRHCHSPPYRRPCALALSILRTRSNRQLLDFIRLTSRLGIRLASESKGRLK